MKKCPFCAEEIQDEAVICRYCNKKQPTIPKPYVPVDKATKNFQLTIAILVIVLLIICGIGSGIWKSKDTTEKPKDASSAWYTCEIFIERVLKAPSTADFEHFNENKVYSIGQNKWAAEMYVDAENSFGANIRSVFYCETEYFPEKDEWILLEIDER